MQLKGYQKRVIEDLEAFVKLSKELDSTKKAFDQLWEERLGPFDALTGKGMRPYQNNIPGAAHVCLKVPTAGGKTYLAVNALQAIFAGWPIEKPKVVMWLVPWSNLLDQTYQNLNNPDHPYRQRLNSLFAGSVAVYRKEDVLQASSFSPASVRDQLTVIVMSFASLRAKNKDARKVYQENSQLAPFASTYASSDHLLENTDETALINVIRSLEPVVVLDESHNAESDLSVDMLQALRPSFVLDLTATPRSNSNILSIVPAMELKKEHMVKLPVIVYNHRQREEVIDSALHLQRQLEAIAKTEEKNGGKYIRPIVLFQAQPRTGEEKITYAKLKETLVKLKIPEDQIKIKTAEIDELKGINLMSKKCPVRYIITVNALKEGWDCPFAYILASLADKSSAVDVEQILGRVLRQPFVMQHSEAMLNLSYVLTASAKFSDTLNTIVKSLLNAGFSETDYRQQDAMPQAEKEEIKEAERKAEIQKALFGNASQPEATPTTEINTTVISFDGEMSETEEADGPQNPPSSVTEIAELAKREAEAMEQKIKDEQAKPKEETRYGDMKDKITAYEIVEAAKALVADLVLPVFKIEIPGSIFQAAGLQRLNRELLLKDFILSREDTKIDFEQAKVEFYKIDLEETTKGEYSPRYGRVDNPLLREEFVKLFAKKTKGDKIKHIGKVLMDQMGKMPPIADQELRLYVWRLLGQLDEFQLSEAFDNRITFAKQIESKIRQLSDGHAEREFVNMVKLGQITCEAEWKFPHKIIPKAIGPALSKSLFKREGEINSEEQAMIEQIIALDNIAFWHRNPSKSGFVINGFKGNHYPDFILITKSSKVILLEYKSTHLKNPDNEAKCRLGNKWADLAGSKFQYFMVFKENPFEGGYTIEEAKKLIGRL